MNPERSMTTPSSRPVPPAQRWTDHDLWLFSEGRHYEIYRVMGAHPGERDGTKGTWFSVWAPNAATVGVFGDFNDWQKPGTEMRPLGSSGIWETFIPGAARGDRYKYHVRSRQQGYEADKADPVGFKHENPPNTASIVWDLDFEWSDDEWQRERGARNRLDAPISIYEIHLGSWMRVPEEGNRMLGYREIAHKLADHVAETGFTHVELLPVMEHPFYGSWGYQTTGYFAPTSRHGDPQDLMYLINLLHRRGIGVILDWVPSHFPSDAHGLAYFDGTHLYEHEDAQRRVHPDWNSYTFNLGRWEVAEFLISSALFWLDRYHVDGLRVDAVASMLYLDYSRKQGEWTPNEHGGREDLDSIRFLRRFNEVVYRTHPDVQTIAEESTAWPMVSRPTEAGGLGFGLKWDMGWMHDTLSYMSQNPIHRAHHHGKLTFRGLYAFHENFVLPLSHDEVVHGKGSLFGKMPGDPWQKFANLRTLLACMFSLPGKKLLFMGAELAVTREWYHEESLDWRLLDEFPHAAMRRLVGRLNDLVRNEPALHRKDHEPDGFEWIEANDAPYSVYAYQRMSGTAGDELVIVPNFTPVPRHNYRVGVPAAGTWRELLNSDAQEYGGSGHGNMGAVESAPVPAQGRPHSVNLVLPPLGVLFLKRERGT